MSSVPPRIRRCGVEPGGWPAKLRVDRLATGPVDNFEAWTASSTSVRTVRRGICPPTGATRRTLLSNEGIRVRLLGHALITAALVVTTLAAAGSAATAQTVPADRVSAVAPAEPDARRDCGDWHSAVAAYGGWSDPIQGDCTVFGHAGKPQFKVGYRWAVPPTSNGRICVQARGFKWVAGRGRVAAWFNAGCGTSGKVLVPWGNATSPTVVRAKVQLGFLGGAFRWKAPDYV